MTEYFLTEAAQPVLAILFVVFVALYVFCIIVEEKYGD